MVVRGKRADSCVLLVVKVLTKFSRGGGKSLDFSLAKVEWVMLR